MKMCGMLQKPAARAVTHPSCCGVQAQPRARARTLPTSPLTMQAFDSAVGPGFGRPGNLLAHSGRDLLRRGTVADERGAAHVARLMRGEGPRAVHGLAVVPHHQV